ncbi:MAG: cyclic nucleotide-binding domain-containing protein [Myxococcaceae bacterium]
MQVAEALKASALFKGFTDTGIQIIGGIASARSYPKGVPLFAENMLADSLLILAEGTVHLSSKSKAGDEVPLGELGPGDFLGELSLIQQGQRLCTATATSAVTAIEIRHADFQRLLAAKPQACLKLLMSVVSHFGQKVMDNKDALKSLLTKV